MKYAVKHFDKIIMIFKIDEELNQFSLEDMPTEDIIEITVCKGLIYDMVLFQRAEDIEQYCKKFENQEYRIVEIQ